MKKENERAYHDFLRDANRAPIDDEYAALAAFDALTREYDLERYPTPHAWERLERLAPSALVCGVFSFYGGGSMCAG